MKQLDFFFDLGQQVLRVFLRFAMVVVAFVVEHVALQLVLRILNLLGLLLERICVLQLIEFIALVIATACRSVILPQSQANPTELVFTSDASHVIAPLIFLDALLAVWTRLRVSHDPLHIGTFRRVLFIPLHGNFAVSRLVALIAAQEAERSPAVAPHFCYGGVNAFLVTHLTPLGRAPLDPLVIIGVRFAKPFPIRFELLRGQQSLEDAVAYFDIAINLHALCVETGATFLDLVGEILTPASEAEGVAALRQCEPIILSQRVVTDQTKTAIMLHQARVYVGLTQRKLFVVNNPEGKLELRLLLEPLRLHELLVPAEMSSDFNQGIKV